MRFMDAYQAVNFLYLSRPTLNKLVNQGSLKPIEFDGALFFRIKELKEFKKSYKRYPKGRKRKEIHNGH